MQKWIYAAGAEGRNILCWAEEKQNSLRQTQTSAGTPDIYSNLGITVTKYHQISGIKFKVELSLCGAVSSQMNRIGLASVRAWKLLYSSEPAS